MSARVVAVLMLSVSCGRSDIFEAALPQQDAGHHLDAGTTCDFDATLVSDVFGKVVFANGGAPWPAGRYRVSYVDGCMKYSDTQDWSVNAYSSGTTRFWLVDGNQTMLFVAPGTVGIVAGQGGFATFDACVSANHLVPPLDFDFAGGKLGIWLSDAPWTDNITGVGGRNPTWRIVSVSCD